MLSLQKQKEMFAVLQCQLLRPKEWNGMWRGEMAHSFSITERLAEMASKSIA